MSPCSDLGLEGRRSIISFGCFLTSTKVAVFIEFPPPLRQKLLPSDGVKQVLCQHTSQSGMTHCCVLKEFLTPSPLPCSRP